MAEGQYVSFRVGEGAYGVEISRVKEIIAAGEITRVPETPPFVRGVINLRGRVIPVISLRSLFDLGEGELSAGTRIVVAELGEISVGLEVDSVLEVTRLAPEQVEPPSPLIAGRRGGYIKGVAKLKESLLVLLDLDWLLSREEREAVAEALAGGQAG